jgi:hypothetical protein
MNVFFDVCLRKQNYIKVHQFVEIDFEQWALCHYSIDPLGGYSEARHLLFSFAFAILPNAFSNRSLSSSSIISPKSKRCSLDGAQKAVGQARQSHRAKAVASSIPTNWARIKAGAADGAIPAKVSDNARATVTAGLANEVDAVNQ